MYTSILLSLCMMINYKWIGLWKRLDYKTSVKTGIKSCIWCIVISVQKMSKHLLVLLCIGLIQVQGQSDGNPHVSPNCMFQHVENLSYLHCLSILELGPSEKMWSRLSGTLWSMWRGRRCPIWRSEWRIWTSQLYSSCSSQSNWPSYSGSSSMGYPVVHGGCLWNYNRT